MKNQYNRLSSGLAFSALTVSGVCLVVSLGQSKLFIESSMGSGPQSMVMVAGLFGILLASHCIARMAAQCIKAKVSLPFIIMGLTAVMCIEGLSIGISTVSFDGNLLASSRTTNQSSPEYLQTLSNIKLYQDQIKSLQKQSDGLPNDWISRKRELSDQILNLQDKVMQQQDKASRINVSVSDQAFNRMESTIGIGQKNIALIMGILLSLVPLVVNLLAGSLNWIDEPVKAKQGKPAAKKPRARLRTVPA